MSWDHYLVPYLTPLSYVLIIIFIDLGNEYSIIFGIPNTNALFLLFQYQKIPITFPFVETRTSYQVPYLPPSKYNLKFLLIW